MSRDLFQMVMEAEGDLLQPFDGGDVGDTPAPEPPNDDSTPQQSSNENVQQGFDEPPPLSEDDDFQYSDEGSEDNIGGDDNSTDDDNEEDNKLSEKANNILNQRLYQQMLNRNSEIEEIIENIQTIVPLLPYDVVKKNDESLNRLKVALNKGQNYVISKFVDSQYGENLLFYQKLDSLYTLLLNSINDNLKKIKDN